ncbi:MAG: glycosyltransferase [Actinomycetota bacterium]|nr:glycosyltransferase [Actinomycetota bacterium]
MKICMIGNARAVHLQRWAKAFRDAGHDVDIISIRAASIPGIPVHTIAVGPANDPSRSWSFLSYARLAAEARRAVRRCDPDVVHAHFTSTSGVFARASGRHPVVTTAWGSDIVPADGIHQSRTLRFINRWALAGADRITVTSRYMTTWATDLLPGAVVDIVPFGVDTDAFHPRTEPAESSGPSIGLVKSLEPRYGIEHAIRAMPIILNAEPGAQLTIAGEGSLRSDLETLVEDLGLGGAVEFVGRVEHDSVPHLMRSFDVLLNTTVVPESFGVVILEGSATGIPVVTSDVGGVREVCVDNRTALLIPPGDVTALATAVVTLAQDQGMRERFGAAGRAFVQEHFEWDHSVTAMLTVLEDAVRRS